MELRIGILHSPRELAFETSEPAAQIEQNVTEALTSGKPVVRFTDDKQRVFLVNVNNLAYLEIGEESQRRIGFVA